jgi:hypothetical protein
VKSAQPLSSADIDRTSIGGTFDANTLNEALLRQQHHELTNDKYEKEQELQAIDDHILSVVLLYARYAHVHGLSFTPEAQPLIDPGQSKRASAYLHGSRACVALGIIVFALLSVASLDLPVPTVILFLASAVVGAILGVIVNSGIALVTKASPANPKAERTISRVGIISGLVVLLSAGAFMLLRFMDVAAQSLVSVVLVSFEAGVYTLGGALAAGHAIYSWNRDLVLKYDSFTARRASVARELHAIEEGVKRLHCSVQKPMTKGELRHEDHNTVLSSRAGDNGDSRRQQRESINGLDRS